MGQLDNPCHLTFVNILKSQGILSMILFVNDYFNPGRLDVSFSLKQRKLKLKECNKPARVILSAG